MSGKNDEKTGLKVFQVLETLLFLGKMKNVEPQEKSKPKAKNDISNQVLLKIERAEIMAAMLAMREDKDKKK